MDEGEHLEISIGQCFMPALQMIVFCRKSNMITIFLEIE